MTTGRGLTAKFRRLRPLVLARAGYRCECLGCGRCPGWCSRRATTVDHIRPRVEGGGDVLDNLRAMCRPCNSSLGATVGNKRRATHPTLHRFINTGPPPCPASLSFSPHGEGDPKMKMGIFPNNDDRTGVLAGADESEQGHEQCSA